MSQCGNSLTKFLKTRTKNHKSRELPQTALETSSGQVTERRGTLGYEPLRLSDGALGLLAGLSVHSEGFT